MRSFTWIMVIACLGASLASAQSYNNLRFEEDWTGMPEAGYGDWSDPIKLVDLGHGVKLSLGGSARMRYEAWENFGFGEANDDEFTLYRAFLHSDWRFGDHWRVFVEGRAATVNNRDLPGLKRAALDIDEFDLWNTFVEGNFDIGGAAVKLRLGRQELQFGAQRLVSPLDWANNRRIFDGGLLRISAAKGWQLDAFVTAPVSIDPDEFTWNDTDHTRLFSGLYFTQPLKDGRFNLELYALALNHIDDAPIEEDRYTLGGRLYGKINEKLTFDTELAVQFGERDYKAGQRFPTGWPRDEEDILAWMFTAEATYTFADAAWKPWVTLGLDYATGDDELGDDDNNTFSHLFPLAHAYLGFSDIVARQNVIDARVTVGAWPIPGKLRFRGDLHFLWLEDEDDGLYAVSGALGRSNLITTPGRRTVSVDEDDIGVALDLTAFYKINKHADVLLGYSHVFAGDFIEDTGAPLADEDIDFWYAQAQYRF